MFSFHVHFRLPKFCSVRMDSVSCDDPSDLNFFVPQKPLMHVMV